MSEIINIQDYESSDMFNMNINEFYTFQFFTSLCQKCIITKSSEEIFPQIIQQCQLDPVTTFHFTVEKSLIFATFCCQNICILIEIDNIDLFRNTIQTHFIHKTLFPSTNYDDIAELEKYIPLCAVTIPSKRDQSLLFSDTRKTKEIFNQYNFSNYYTLSTFLYFTLDTIISYSIRRFYYPTVTFTDPSFFTILNPNLKYRDFLPDEFALLHHIGTGGGGKVSLQIHKKSGYLVALKFMKTKATTTKTEIDILQKSNHPLILHCYGQFITAAETVIVTDYMCNGNLDIYCKDQSLDQTTKTKAIAEILCGIDYLHSIGIIHQDLKPLNILVSHDNDFILSDFGTALNFKKKKKRKDVQMGTFHYMAPEMMQESKSYFWSDLYSFGVIIYELATGKNPFEDLSYSDFIDFFKSGKIQPLPPKCGTITKLYKRCMEGLKEKRAVSVYLLEMFFNEILFFANSDVNYTLQLQKKIRKIQDKYVTHGKDRIDIQMVIDLANEGNPVGMFNLGVIYHNGWCHYKKDFKSALKWFTRAADKEIPAAIYDIGNMYFRNRGVPIDYKKAFEYYKKSAEMNFIEGYNGLGNMYYEGKVPIQNRPGFYHPPDFKKALECYKYAAERGHSYAMFNCGRIFYYGKLSNGKRDMKNALYWFQKANEVMNKDAEYRLGRLYYKGLIGDGPNPEMAFELFTLASAQKLPKATYRKACMLRDGVGVKKNDKMAAKEFRMAVIHFNKFARAMIDLAELIVEGKVERKDYCDDGRNDDEDKIEIFILFEGSEEEVKKNFLKERLLDDALVLLNMADDCLREERMNVEKMEDVKKVEANNKRERKKLEELLARIYDGESGGAVKEKANEIMKKIAEMEKM